MTDAQWIAVLRKHLAQFGKLVLGRPECERMKPWLHSDYEPQLNYVIRFNAKWVVNMAAGWDLLDDMERGIAEAVTNKLAR